MKSNKYMDDRKYVGNHTSETTTLRKINCKPEFLLPEEIPFKSGSKIKIPFRCTKAEIVNPRWSCTTINTYTMLYLYVAVSVRLLKY